jgi:hypothetical protein
MAYQRAEWWCSPYAATLLVTAATYTAASAASVKRTAPTHEFRVKGKEQGAGNREKGRRGEKRIGRTEFIQART